MTMQIEDESAGFVAIFIPRDSWQDLNGVHAYQFMQDHGLRVLAFRDEVRVTRKGFLRKSKIYGQLVMCEKLPTFAGLPE